VVDIEGVQYKMFPETKWNLHPDGNIIGYAGSYKTTVEVADGDTERNFVFLQDIGSSMYYIPLYRTDKIIPEPSENSVNEILYYEEDYRRDEVKRYSNTITDKEIIKELFDILKTGERTSDISFIEGFSLRISCFSDEVPGAYYNLNIERSDGKLMCGLRADGYVEIPIELLEKIAGHEINIDELLSE